MFERKRCSKNIKKMSTYGEGSPDLPNQSEAITKEQREVINHIASYHTYGMSYDGENDNYLENKPGSLKIIRCSECGVLCRSESEDVATKCNHCQEQNYISHSIFSADDDEYYMGNHLESKPELWDNYNELQFPPNGNLLHTSEERTFEDDDDDDDDDDDGDNDKKSVRKSDKNKNNEASNQSDDATKSPIQMNENGSFVCELCQRAFKLRKNLILHRKRHSEGDEHTCNICQKTFLSVDYFKKHLRLHTNERPFVCSFCKKSYTQSSTLKQHIRIHTGEKPYRCDVCDRAFTVRDYLNKHMRTHTGEKPYGCNLCDKKYSQSHALKKHKLTHVVTKIGRNT